MSAPQSSGSTPQRESKQEFLSEANQAAPGTMSEIWTYLRHNKKWWLTPIILVLILVGALVILAGTSAAPLIYTLF